jgi:hypothetical protein
VLNKLDQHDAALKSYEKAITIKPDYAEALCLSPFGIGLFAILLASTLFVFSFDICPYAFATVFVVSIAVSNISAINAGVSFFVCFVLCCNFFKPVAVYTKWQCNRVNWRQEVDAKWVFNACTL